MKDNYSLFPQKQILPYDGMSITAGVWAELHDYHQQLQYAHQYFLHGSGIVTGLEVVASDPVDSVVFILAGVAVDNAGRMIVLPEPVAYDLGNKIEGKLHLLLMHREVKLQAETGEENNGPTYMRNEYIIIARNSLIDAPYVELARIDRRGADAPIHEAADPAAPQPNSIDLRFRRSVCPPPEQHFSAGVVCLGDAPEQDYARGLAHLARPLAEQTPYRLVVEKNAALTKEVFNNQLVYLTVRAGTTLKKDQAGILHDYLENGGRLLVEYCDLVKDEEVASLLKPVGVSLEKLAAPHPVYQSPHLFVFPPQGSVTGTPGLWGAPDVLACNAGYGAAWSGQVARAEFTRSVIRDTVEWGVNLLAWLLAD